MYGIVFLCFCLVLPLYAHNGEVAIAVPVEGIVVDGYFADWPEDIVRYPVEHFTQETASSGDLSANFRLGYNLAENVVYVALEVLDDSVLGNLENSSWRQDGTELYLNLGHSIKNTGTYQYVVWGDARRASRAGVGSREADLQVEIYRGANRRQYEWKIDYSDISEIEFQITEHMALDFSLSVYDLDSDGSFTTIAWGPGSNKFQNTTQLGDMVLLPEYGHMAKLKGRVRWSGLGKGVSYALLRIQSLLHEDMWLSAYSNFQGNFELDIPVGSYRVISTTGEQTAEYIVDVEVDKENYIDI